MAPYSVYEASFVTQRGTSRSYIGMTGWWDLRLGFMKTDPPAFMKPMRLEGADLRVREVTANIPSKPVAIVLEAMLAARAIAKAPRQTRGGPWSQPGPLGPAALEEIRRVARCRTLMAVAAVAEQHPHGPLWKHVCGLQFTKAADAPRSSPIVRGAFVCKAKVPGTPGNLCRKRQMRKCVLKRGSPKHKIFHRGRNLASCRRRETARRGGRR